jgi:hypothetical protein
MALRDPVGFDAFGGYEQDFFPDNDFAPVRTEDLSLDSVMDGLTGAFEAPGGFGDREVSFLGALIHRAGLYIKHGAFENE